MKIPFFSKSETAIDPVCQMEVDVSNPPGGSSEYEGQKYYFCGPGCQVAFQRDTSSFLDDPSASSDPKTGVAAQESVLATEHTSGWDFRLMGSDNDPDLRVVEYSCRCGCTPKARFRVDSDEPGSEHCCCGRVHFAGQDAYASLRAYMHERATKDMDADVGRYQYETTELVVSQKAPISVAFAEPAKPRK